MKDKYDYSLHEKDLNSISKDDDSNSLQENLILCDFFKKNFYFSFSAKIKIFRQNWLKKKKDIEIFKTENLNFVVKNFCITKKDVQDI